MECTSNKAVDDLQRKIPNYITQQNVFKKKHTWFAEESVKNKIWKNIDTDWEETKNKPKSLLPPKKLISSIQKKNVKFAMNLT